MNNRRLTSLVSTCFLFVLIGHSVARADIEIVLQNDFIESHKDKATIDVDYVVDMAHKRPNPASKDGDLHIAGRAEEVKLPIVAEIMNAKSTKDAVDFVHSIEGTAKKAPLSGAWRIWCEHGGSTRQVQGEPLEPFETTNPDHVFEIHPITKLNGISLLSTLREIEGYEAKDAETAFNKYESIPCEIALGDGTTTINTRMAGYNYVEFAARLTPRATDVEDGRLVMAEICDLDGELLVRNRRLVFIKDSGPEIKTRGVKGKLVHLLGIPRIDLALVSWRAAEAARPGGNKEVLKWGLPYEIIVVGYYDTLADSEASDSVTTDETSGHTVKGRVIVRDVEPNRARRKLYNHSSERLSGKDHESD